MSSQIEGTQASLLDVLEFESELAKNSPSDKRDVYEVINYISAFNYGFWNTDDCVRAEAMMRGAG